MRKSEKKQNLEMMIRVRRPRDRQEKPKNSERKKKREIERQVNRLQTTLKTSKDIR